ncbi:MAG: hypothetical protein JO357_12145 [Hyphomicrobiales bacterium]|nr:hypothetical protein [Hyphomicrobiales bacterium]MBV9052848.1 hypothetical protein [Hyphomicrobiales bacterium]MBV9137798.1 hypothetical protein [Hyphomicrobiales bacterium]MBV9591995.1 hypothetical protein [Hyphomicrobiales bacterium]MBV9975008.1 hypothetical protein [Hyphomicrobiales bacterium]
MAISPSEEIRKTLERMTAMTTEMREDIVRTRKTIDGSRDSLRNGDLTLRRVFALPAFSSYANDNYEAAR